MAKKVNKQKVVEASKSPSVVVKLPKKVFLYVIVVLAVAGLIYLGGKSLLVASVNGQYINRLAVIKELEKQGGQKTLDTIILKALINQEAKKNNVIVNQKDVDAEISKIEANVKTQGYTLDQLLTQQGMTKSILNDEIKTQLMVTKLVGDSVTVTEKEIADYITSQSTGTATPPTPEQAGAQLKQQKLQAKIQTYLADLKAKAKINYFMKY